MSKKRRGFWLALFICVATLLGGLAALWNVILVQDHRQISELTANIPHALPWRSIILGTLGFVATLVGLALFFLKTLKEMKLNQLQSEFLATVTHELKTPITSLELASSLLKSGDPTPEEAAQLWSTHELELRRLRTEVESLLEAARLEARVISPPEKTVINLEEWFSHSLDRWRRILGADASITRKGDPLPAKALSHLRTLNLITDNLIDNTRKFARGKPEVEIETQIIPGGGWRIAIRDHGWGFAASDSKRLFHRFFRGRTPAPYAIEGTGLGLYIARSASQSIGLSLRGNSPGPGRGCVFEISGTA